METRQHPVGENQERNRGRQACYDREQETGKSAMQVLPGYFGFRRSRVGDFLEDGFVYRLFVSRGVARLSMRRPGG